MRKFRKNIGVGGTPIPCECSIVSLPNHEPFNDVGSSLGQKKLRPWSIEGVDHGDSSVQRADPPRDKLGLADDVEWEGRKKEMSSAGSRGLDERGISFPPSSDWRGDGCSPF